MADEKTIKSTNRLRLPQDQVIELRLKKLDVQMKKLELSKVQLMQKLQQARTNKFTMNLTDPNQQQTAE